MGLLTRFKQWWFKPILESDASITRLIIQLSSMLHTINENQSSTTRMLHSDMNALKKEINNLKRQTNIGQKQQRKIPTKTVMNAPIYKPNSVKK